MVRKRVYHQKENIHMKSRAGLSMEKEIFNEDLAFCKNQKDINRDVADSHSHSSKQSLNKVLMKKVKLLLNPKKTCMKNYMVLM